jgi:membrane protein DedA with SNARE-associated domain/rhodanese-related sulfurtransferase
MRTLALLIEQHGLWFVFFNVLLEQAGIPIPAYPVLIVASAIAYERGQPVWLVLAVAVLACLIADAGWYLAGRRVGRPIMKVLCRVTLSPDSCVRQTQSIYERWGPPSLMLAKFIPGFASLATALAGDNRTPKIQFLLYDAIGAALWAGLAIIVGVLFHAAIDDVLNTLTQLGRYGIGLILLALLIYLAYRWFDRWRFQRELRMARVTVNELAAMIQGGTAPIVLDVRSATSQRRDGRIPGAQLVSTDVPLDVAGGHEVVVYCACPNEASAAVLARQLKAKGFRKVRPLQGGIAAWIAAGLPVEAVEAVERQE